MTDEERCGRSSERPPVKPRGHVETGLEVAGMTRRDSCGRCPPLVRCPVRSRRAYQCNTRRARKVIQRLGAPTGSADSREACRGGARRAAIKGATQEHPASRPEARVRVARVSDRGKGGISVVGVAALVGAKRSDAKARASRANGRLGGRPRKSGTSRTARRKASR
jgi:hypothetical protein